MTDWCRGEDKQKNLLFSCNKNANITITRAHNISFQDRTHFLQQKRSRRKLMDGQYQPRADASPVEMEVHEEKQKTTTQNFAIKSHKTWHQCCLSPLVNFRVISHVLPLVLSPRAMRNRNMCSITPTV